MTLADRIACFRSTYSQWPASWPTLVQEGGRDVLYATWLIGAMYGNASKFYGAYPRTYLERMLALFPLPSRTLRDRHGNWRGHDVLHAFSGSLPPGPYARLDLNPASGAELVGSVYDLGKMLLGRRPFRLIFADPPYSAADAAQYGTPMIDRGRALTALAAVTKPGGHLVWLDVCWPMFKKTQWRTVGRVTVIRSTNHRVRIATIFERVA